MMETVTTSLAMKNASIKAAIRRYKKLVENFEEEFKEIRKAKFPKIKKKSLNSQV